MGKIILAFVNPLFEVKNCELIFFIFEEIFHSYDCLVAGSEKIFFFS